MQGNLFVRPCHKVLEPLNFLIATQLLVGVRQIVVVVIMSPEKRKLTLASFFSILQIRVYSLKLAAKGRETGDSFIVPVGVLRVYRHNQLDILAFVNF